MTFTRLIAAVIWLSVLGVACSNNPPHPAGSILLLLDGDAEDADYFQSLVVGVRDIAGKQGHEIIVVDDAQAMSQKDVVGVVNTVAPDVVLSAAAQVNRNMGQLASRWPSVEWICWCGDFERSNVTSLFESFDGIGYSTGVAFGILMKDSNVAELSVLGCCSQPQEIDFQIGIGRGLAVVSKHLSVTYVETGRWAGDYDNVEGALEALSSIPADGGRAIVTFLAAPQKPVIAAASDSNTITAFVGGTNECVAEHSPTILVQLQSAAGLLEALRLKLAAGEASPSQLDAAALGVSGATFCRASAERLLELEQLVLGPA
ncbi:MAG: hypothetical protein WCP59_16945 [Actinomycetota bacterium]